MTRLIKYLFIGLALCFCQLLSFAQQSPKVAGKIDSLYSALKTSKEDTSQANTLNALSEELGIIGDYGTAKKYANDALVLSEKMQFKKGRAAAYRNIGVLDFWLGNYADAIENYLSSLKIYEERGDKEGITKLINDIGLVYKFQSDYEKAIEYYLKGIKIIEDIPEKSRQTGITVVLISTYNNIGTAYYKQGNASCLKGDTALARTRYNKSIESSFRSLKINEEVEDKNELADSYNNIGLVYYDQQNYSGALEYFLKSLKCYEEPGNKRGVALSSSYVGQVYLQLGKYKEAIPYEEKALTVARQIGGKEVIKNSSKNLSDIYEALNEYDLAYGFQKQFSEIKDTLMNSEHAMKIARMQEQYESDKKDVQAAEENKKQKIILWSVIGSLFLVLLVAGFILRSLQVTRKQKRIIEIQKSQVEKQKAQVEKQKQIIEGKSESITDSINYARLIQRAMLPHRRDIWQAFPNSFVLFKPKDIVSGDFYFFHKTPLSSGRGVGGEVVFIAVADCTGHGVPGAFMSMLGAEKLKDAVSLSTDTSEILSALNKGIKSSLRQSENDESTKDGMDIVLCSVDTDSRVVKYSGANRPIWIIRKGNAEVEEIKATKKAIGGFTEDSQHFDTHEIKLQQGDTFYIFSDGYTDLFGQNGKKMTIKKFKEILLDIQHKTMKEQEQHLDNFAENWKSGTEQTDDILVIGVRL